MERWEPTPKAGNVNLGCGGVLTTRAPRGPSLILLPHPGDEIACAGLLQHCCDPVVVFATDGMTEDERSCPTLRRQQKLRYERRQEATTALLLAGIQRAEFLGSYGNNMEVLRLHRGVAQLFDVLWQMMTHYRPEAVLVPAYEGGHPDHDVCSFVGALLRTRLNTPVWEMPLYHKSDAGELVYQRFRQMNGTEVIYPLGPEELSLRAAMAACYTSKRDFAYLEADDLECYRPQAEYDYSRPPQNRTVNYENRRCPVSPWELCRQLTLYALRMPVPPAFPGSQQASRHARPQ